MCALRLTWRMALSFVCKPNDRELRRAPELTPPDGIKSHAGSLQVGDRPSELPSVSLSSAKETGYIICLYGCGNFCSIRRTQQCCSYEHNQPVGPAKCSYRPRPDQNNLGTLVQHVCSREPVFRVVRACGQIWVHEPNVWMPSGIGLWSSLLRKMCHRKHVQRQ